MSPEPDPAAERSASRVGEAAGERAAEAGATREETREEIRQAAPSMSDSDVDRLADRLVERFERRGAFDHGPAGSGDAAQEDEPGGEPTQGEREVEGQSGEGPPPRKRKLAERFVGRS